ncbi:MAG: zinc ribbon domain-containing protein [Bacteroidia bacterium]|nr:zinc ribbon domain-containing protein [Bacteroidia bacterium]
MPQAFYIHGRCPECGTQMQYSGDRKQLVCPACGYARALGKDADQVQERALGINASFEGFIRGMGIEAPEYACGSCKTVFLTLESGASSCPCCGSDTLSASAAAGKLLQPHSLIPFTVPRSAAAGLLRKWFSTSRFLPQDITTATQASLRGVYLPCFLVDAFTRSTWKGMMGFSVMEMQKSGPVQKQVWEPTTGYYELLSQDVQVPVSQGLDGKRLAEVFTYRLGDLVGFDPSYLKGWAVELYQKKETEGFSKASEAIDGQIRAEVPKRITATSLKDLKITTERLALGFRVVLLPVWVAQYTYRKKRFQYLINGQTGDIAGDKPISFEKVYAAIAGAVLLLVLLLLLIRLR